MRHFFKARFLRSVAAIAALIFTAGAASANADSYPAKAITLVVPFGAGGTTTTLARLMADQLSQAMGQPFVVENRPGAGGNIAFDHVARARPDGYTLLMGPIGLAINPAIYASLNFDPLKDFEPISLYGGVANILAVSPSLPVKTLDELIAYAKQNPGKLTQGSSGNGSSSHLAGEMLRSQTGIDFVHVPYKGGAQAMQDLLAGQISMLFDQVPAVLPHVQAGKVRALGVTTKERSSGAPDIPTIAEQGLSDYEVNVWFGFLAPKGTPKPIIDKINGHMVKVLNNPEFVARMTSMGVDTMPSTPEEFQQYLEAETARWGKVAKESGATLQ
ncbi:tripartite tricarboxylate transporter substrate binding protein [Pusillimonas sp. SM2304]|uniref:Bug family tripartite tricarboxylate transporter substrate binding protein n=1 Tax=Pusillimonas sp. SM2304 TaxID=3073241 RepID=UPI0028766565|nr:tripartite tricarboxylate transporter substrate binding protein [Pusillimonas sp. SM2304]MDS1140397.1 tripartite tricarboxylate transporter substrate binding protein [Pusillimonas sp. SM2304]